MPVPNTVSHTSRTPAQAMKQPSTDLYHAQGIDPADQLHPSADHFVSQNYGGNIPPTDVHAYYQPPEHVNRRHLKSDEDVPLNSNREEATFQPAAAHHAYKNASRLQNVPDEQELAEHFAHNPPKPDAGRQHGHESRHESQNVSERLPSNVPSTHEMVSNLKKGEHVLEHRKHDTTNVAGDRLIDDLTQVVKDTMNFVEEKNLGDSTRNIIDHSKSATSKVDTPGLDTQNLPSKGAVTQDVSDVASQLRRVTQLMITSPAVRSFMWEFYQLFRDTFGPQIDQVVEKKLGVQEQTDRRSDAARNYDQSAPAISRRHAPARVDDEFSRVFHNQPLSTAHQPVQPLTAQPGSVHILSHETYPSMKNMGETHGVGRSQQSDNTAEFTHPPSDLGYGVMARTQFNEHAPPFQPSTGHMGELRHSEMQPHAGDRFGGQSRAQGERYGDPAVPHVADDIKHAKNQVLDTKNKIPSEKREQLARRWRALFNEVKEDLRIQEAIRDTKQTLVYLRDKYQPVVQEHKEKVKDAALTSADRVQDDDDINIVLSESKVLLERFAGGKSLEPLINIANEWYITIRGDEELREWLEEFYDYLDTTARTPETLQDDRHIDKLDRFLLRGQDIFQGRHSDLSRQLLDETKDFLYSLINDEATSRLRASVQRVIKDLFLDSEGRFVLKPDLYVQLRKAFMPIISEQLSNLRVSHVEDQNDQIDFALTNIIIDANDLKPDQFDVKNVAEISVGKEARDGVELHMEFRVSAKGATCSVRDVNFYYKKHTFPKLKDSGILDASLTGNGLSFDLDIDFYVDALGLEDVGRREADVRARKSRRDRDDHSIFRVKNCRVDIDKLKLDFREANHEILYKVFKPVIVSKTTKAMSRAIEDQLRHFVKELDGAAIQARDQTMTTLDKSGATDRILRGTEPAELNVGHTHNDRQSERCNEPMVRDSDSGHGHNEKGFGQTTRGVASY